MVAKVICVMNRKGGVGKSTTTAELGSEWICMGKTIALYDWDITERTLSNRAEPGSLLFDFVRPAPEDPEDFSLEDALDQIDEDKEIADIIIIDCPPQNQDIAFSALGISDYVIVPCGPSKDERKGTDNTMAIIKEVQAENGGSPKGFLVPYKLTKSNLSKVLPERLETMGKLHKGFSVLPSIDQLADVVNARERDLMLWEFKPSCKARKQYTDLAVAVAKKVGVKVNV